MSKTTTAQDLEAKTIPLTPRHPDTRLESDWLFLYQAMPPETWHDSEHAYKTSFWLNIHADLRQSQQTLEDISIMYQQGKLDWAEYRKHILPRMRQYIAKLHQHHHIEDTGYFPHFVRMFPALQAGFEILDQDHVRLDKLLEEWQVLNRTLADSVEENETLTEQLHTMIIDVGRLMSQHLSDEEDLVIPILGLSAAR